MIISIDPNFLDEEAHEHDESVYSIAIVESQPLNLDKLYDWIGDLLRNRGTDIFPMKGILNIADMCDRIVFQGVHMLFDVTKDRPWQEGETRKSELVFIGRNLDDMNLREGFKGCLD